MKSGSADQNHVVKPISQCVDETFFDFYVGFFGRYLNLFEFNPAISFSETQLYLWMKFSFLLIPKQLFVYL